MPYQSNNLMNYLKIYISLIKKAEKRNYTKTTAKKSGIYVEGHHVFPKSVFGKNNRIVYLTPKEHYIAHALLNKIYIKRYGLKDKKTIKISYAHIMMGAQNKKTNKDRYVNSRLYSSARKKLKEQISGELNPMYGKKHTKEVVEKLKTRIISNETRKRMSESRKKRVHTESSNILRSKSCEKVKYKILCPDGNIHIITNMRKFCREHNLDCSSMVKVSKGKLKSYKNYKVQFLENIK